MKIEKKLWLALFTFGLFAIGFSGWIFSQRIAREELFWDNTIEFTTTESVETEIRTEKIALPEEFNIPTSILFKTTHTVAEVLLDGEKIYQYGNEENAPKFMKSPGSCWHIVDIPKNSAGKSLEVRIIPVYDGYYGNTFNLVYGTRGDCILKILNSSLGTMIISCGILFLGVISILLYFFISLKRKNAEVDEENEIFLNLGIFSLLIAIWALQQCGFMQFLIPDGRTLYYVDFFSFFLFPIPFNFLLYDICKSKYRKGALQLSALYLLNMAVAVILQCTGVRDIFQILPVTHILMAVNAGYMFVLVYYEAAKEKNEAAREFRYPLYIVMGFGVAELVMYYIKKFKSTLVVLPLGTMIFILLLIWIQICRYYDQYVQRQKMIYLQKMANVDMLTEAMNRNAYENMIKYLDEQEIELKSTGVVLFDLDNLKIINDSFGHEKGDEALKLCYQCIRQVFKNEKNCFRIGGDEFAYVYHSDEKEQIPVQLKALEKLLEETGKNLSYPLKVSAGYACYHPDADIDFKDIVRRSDTMLYRQKRRKKVVKKNDADSKKLSYPEKHLTEEITDEVIFREKNYQNRTLEDLCGMIDLWGPTTDNYPYIVDFRTDTFYIVPKVLERFCMSKNAFHNVTEQLREFVYGPDYELLKVELDDLAKTDRCIHNMEYRLMDLKKMPVWINCRGYVVRDDSMKPLYMIGCINEIGERQKADNVSGFLGEAGLREYMNQNVVSWQDGYLLRVGVDHFREINENLGEEYGDYILREIAACISSCLPEVRHRIYKLRADEFMIINASSDSVREADKLYDQIREKIDQFIEDNDFDAVFTISGGILSLKNNSEAAEYSEAMKLTDFALNEAKKRGRNRCYVFDRKDYEQFLRKREITQELREAVRCGCNGFQAFYQPVFAAGGSKLYGAEALMRFSSPKFGRISPGEFIPILEETGLILPAGRWMIREAMKSCSRIREIIPKFRVSINISQVQAAKSNVTEDLVSEMEKAGLTADAIIIELTESDLLERDINEMHLLTELKRMGIQLALDDFGTGYSNFHYLNELNPAIIKIDRSFTASAVADEGEYYLLNQFCNMIHNLGLKLCIEGVETDKEWGKIQKLCPDFSQGFFWGRPCPYEEFVKTFVEK